MSSLYRLLDNVVHVCVTDGSDEICGIRGLVCGEVSTSFEDIRHVQGANALLCQGSM